MTNLELKVRCPDLRLVVERALALGASDEGLLEQQDLYFVVPRGRLKLRLEGERAWLIQYRRPDESGVRASSYSLVAMTREMAEEVGAALEAALGLWGTVEKRRRLLLWKHTRIHVDEVEGLGGFVELETVVTNQPLPEASDECDAAMMALGLDRLESVAGSYSDLLAVLSCPPEAGN